MNHSSLSPFVFFSFSPVEPPRKTEAMFQPCDIPNDSLLIPNKPLREEATIEEIDGGVAIFAEETLSSRLERAVAVMMNFDAVMILTLMKIRIYFNRFDLEPN